MVFLLHTHTFSMDEKTFSDALGVFLLKTFKGPIDAMVDARMKELTTASQVWKYLEILYV
jgi:hypothetical protein